MHVNELCTTRQTRLGREALRQRVQGPGHGTLARRNAPKSGEEYLQHLYSSHFLSCHVTLLSASGQSSGHVSIPLSATDRRGSRSGMIIFRRISHLNDKIDHSLDHAYSKPQPPADLLEELEEDAVRGEGDVGGGGDGEENAEREPLAAPPGSRELRSRSVLHRRQEERRHETAL